jgi:predicted O-methyltransferase YrrM
MVVCKPKIVIEIGTATGLSALAMKAAMPAGSRLFTFDIVPWDKIDETVLLPQRSCGWNVVNCHR